VFRGNNAAPMQKMYGRRVSVCAMVSMLVNDRVSARKSNL